MIDPEAALEACYELARAGELERALEQVQALTAADPGFAPAWRIQARLLDDLERSVEALECADRRLELEPDAAQGHFDRGLILQGLGDLEGAIDAYRRATELDPAHPWPWVNLGRLLDDIGECEEAIAAYDRALALEDDAVAWSNRGNSLQTIERFEEALESYERALALEPDDPTIQLGHCCTLGALGRIEEANAARPSDPEFDRGDLVERRVEVHGRPLVARFYPGQHSAPERLEELVDDMLATVAGCADTPPGLGDGVRIAYGWSVLTIRERDGGYVICEPAFLEADPTRHVSHDVSFTTQTMFMIYLLHSLVEVSPAECLFVDDFDVVPESLHTRHMALHRLHARDDASGHSGWVMGPPNREALLAIDRDAECVRAPTSLLARQRHHAIKVLTLPPGYTAFFDGHAVVSVLDPEGVEVYDVAE